MKCAVDTCFKAASEEGHYCTDCYNAIRFSHIPALNKLNDIRNVFEEVASFPKKKHKLKEIRRILDEN